MATLKDYKLDFQSELPIEFVNEFKIEVPDKTRTLFTFNHDMILQEFEDDTVICVARDSEFLTIYSNRKFNQTIPVRSKKVIISFEE